MLFGLIRERFPVGCSVRRNDTGDVGTLLADRLDDYVSVKWDAGYISWIRAALLVKIESPIS